MMRKFIIWTLRAFKWLVILILVFVGSLFFREQRIPKWMVSALVDRYAGTNIVVRCGEVSFGFKRGLSVSNVRVHDLSGTFSQAGGPVVAFSSLTCNPLAKTLAIDDLAFRRLHDAYYRDDDPSDSDDAPAAENADAGGPVKISVPRFGGWNLSLTNPDILGIAPASVTAVVGAASNRLDVGNIYVDWGDRYMAQNQRMSVTGSVAVDFDAMRLHSEILGQAIQPQIRPLLVALDIPSSYYYFDAFTEVPGPVPARGTFDADFTNGDFWMRLDLSPPMGRYNGVKMAKAEGTLDLYVYRRDGHLNTRLGVALPLATDYESHNLSGNLLVDMTNEVVTLSFDVDSTLELGDALKIANGFLEPSDVVVEAETAPHLKVKGLTGVDVEQKDRNALSFTTTVERASLFGFKMRGANAAFRLDRDKVVFDQITAKGKDGGDYAACGFIHIPDFEPEDAAFSNRVDVTDGTVKELADIFDMKLTDQEGRVNGWCEISGLVNSNKLAKSLNGAGSFKIRDGRIIQLPIFAGLTEGLAKHVPGVDFLVTRSEASADFTIKDGVFESSNIYIEGGLFSLKIYGTYDIAGDVLDFTVRVQFMKSESIAGKILHPVTWPFTKLLLEFKAEGSIEDPQWKYISVIDRIL